MKKPETNSSFDAKKAASKKWHKDADRGSSAVKKTYTNNNQQHHKHNGEKQHHHANSTKTNHKHSKVGFNKHASKKHPEDDQPHVVIVSNVVSELATIYAELLPRCLFPSADLAPIITDTSRRAQRSKLNVKKNLPKQQTQNSTDAESAIGDNQGEKADGDNGDDDGAVQATTDPVAEPVTEASRCTVHMRTETMTAQVHYTPGALGEQPHCDFDSLKTKLAKRHVIGHPIRLLASGLSGPTGSKTAGGSASEEHGKTGSHGTNDNNNGSSSSSTSSADRQNEVDGIQKSLVSAKVSVSRAVSPKTLDGLLATVPGYVSCFRKHRGTASYRVVFRTLSHLFGAKMLLDEFEADGGLRVTVSLGNNEALNTGYSDFIQRKLNAEE